jgi:HEPN domain-containing protein
MLSTTKRLLALFSLGIVAACEEGPITAPAEPGPNGAEVAAAAVNTSWDLLLSEEDVQIQTLEALESGPNTGAEAALVGAAGDDAYLEAAVAVFGGGFAANAVSNVEVAIGNVSAALSPETGGSSVRGAVDRARSHAARARSELSGGRDVEALRFAVAAADELRGIDPERRAREFVQQALRLLEKAKELAGSDPRPEIAAALREATDHCDAAVRALEAGHWAIAVREAGECAEIARRVIGLLSGGVGDDRLQELARELVGEADRLYDRAVELAGPNPEPDVERALDHAGELLRGAKEALAQEDWREAVRLARESIEISKRVIDFLSNDPPGDLEARARQAVNHAKELLVRAVELAGDSPRAEILVQLSTARELVHGAMEALGNGEFRVALEKAQAAIRILNHVITVLS